MELKKWKGANERREQWQQAIIPILKPPDKPALDSLIENISDALREVAEAAVAGSAAQEEMSRAQDLGSETGMAAADLREDSAKEMLTSAHLATLAATRNLLSALGYVGPIDKMEEMPRPSWASDVKFIDQLRLLSGSIHAATTSGWTPSSGSSTWQEVMRSASKLKESISTFPQSALPAATEVAVGSAEGRILDC